jgi:predicted transposase/invertase (TIGR01784 family)
MNLVTSWEQEGIEKGRLEAQRAIALNMLNHNLSPEMIAQVTGLALEQG